MLLQKVSVWAVILLIFALHHGVVDVSAFHPVSIGHSPSVSGRLSTVRRYPSPKITDPPSNQPFNNITPQRTSRTELSALVDIVGTSPEPIHSAFSVATFFPQPFWLLIILLPNAKVTKKIMGSMNVVLLCALVHFFIVTGQIVLQEGTAPIEAFNEVFDLGGDPQAAFMSMATNYPNFVAEEWSHVLAWDLFVGRWIWLDGLERQIFTAHSVLFTNLIGPPGLLLHWITCFITGKGFVGNQALSLEDKNEDDGIL